MVKEFQRVTKRSLGRRGFGLVTNTILSQCFPWKVCGVCCGFIEQYCEKREGVGLDWRDGSGRESSTWTGADCPFQEPLPHLKRTVVQSTLYYIFSEPVRGRRRIFQPSICGLRMQPIASSGKFLGAFYCIKRFYF